MKQIKTIIYGGAFNPPTIAHEMILKACVDYARKINAHVWIMPSGDRLDKQIRVNRNTRIDYLFAMINDTKAWGIADVITTELDRKEAVETCVTVDELTRMFPARSFIWVFGSDSIQTMSNWRKGTWLLDNLEILVINRHGSIIDSAKTNFTFLETDTIVVSSTEVRQRLETGESVRDLVGPSVIRLLTKNTSP